MVLIWGVKDALVFHVVNKIVKYVSTTSEDLSTTSIPAGCGHFCLQYGFLYLGLLKGDNIYHATSVFSPPLSDRTRDGRPHVSIATWKCGKTVNALLLVEHER